MHISVKSITERENNSIKMKYHEKNAVDNNNYQFQHLIMQFNINDDQMSFLLSFNFDNLF